MFEMLSFSCFNWVFLIKEEGENGFKSLNLGEYRYYRGIELGEVEKINLFIRLGLWVYWSV